jgi:hypothetical protein
MLRQHGPLKGFDCAERDSLKPRRPFQTATESPDAAEQVEHAQRLRAVRRGHGATCRFSHGSQSKHHATERTATCGSTATLVITCGRNGLASAAVPGAQRHQSGVPQPSQQTGAASRAGGFT